MTDPGTKQPAPPLSTPYPATRKQLAIVAGVGIWQVALALLAVVAVFWTWTIAERISATESSVHVHWIGPDFTVSATTAALLLAGVAGVTGSVVQTVGVFSSRVDRRTFEGTYVWWYVLRPFAAADARPARGDQYGTEASEQPVPDAAPREQASRATQPAPI